MADLPWSYKIVIVFSMTSLLVSASFREVDYGVGDEIAADSRVTNGIMEVAHRHIRSLSYPEESEMGIFFALAIPLDDPLSKKSVSVAFFFEANYQLIKKEERRKRRSLDRRSFYALLESKFESLGYPGQQCLLRSICETAQKHWDDALHEHNGLIGNLMRIIFRPSTSADENIPSEYTSAEDAELDCASSYRFCPFSIYQYISE